jgi:hypothetical protein
VHAPHCVLYGHINGYVLGQSFIEAHACTASGCLAVLLVLVQTGPSPASIWLLACDDTSKPKPRGTVEHAEYSFTVHVRC